VDAGSVRSARPSLTIVVLDTIANHAQLLCFGVFSLFFFDFELFPHTLFSVFLRVLQLARYPVLSDFWYLFFFFPAMTSGTYGATFFFFFLRMRLSVLSGPRIFAD